MTGQASLPLGAPALRPVVESLIPKVIAALDGRGWVLRRQLSRELGVNERAIRDAANFSGGRVISSNQGYKLTLQATPDDMNAFYGRLRSQEIEMAKRRMDTEKVWHSRHVTEAA